MVVSAIICSFMCDPVILSGRKAWSKCLTGTCIFEGKKEQMRVWGWRGGSPSLEGVTQQTGQAEGMVAGLTLACTALYRQLSVAY